ncbi:MAG: thiamine diphosphokinase, partial [Lachnospiraceae bacterium]|nr:thiamine diphosphokinase [Lachnospiraceae bacterium]
MRCVIMGAGDFCENITFKANDLIIAADGGLRHLEGIGVKPEFVIVDFDSLGYVPSDLKVIQKPVEKDETDMYLAIREG